MGCASSSTSTNLPLQADSQVPGQLLATPITQQYSHAVPRADARKGVDINAPNEIRTGHDNNSINGISDVKKNGVSEEVILTSTSDVSINFTSIVRAEDDERCKRTINGKYNEVDTNIPMKLTLIRATYHENDITDSVSSFIRSDQSLELLGGIKGKDANEAVLDMATSDNRSGSGKLASVVKVRKMSAPTVKISYMYQSNALRSRVLWGESKFFAPAIGTKISLVSAFIGPKGFTSKVVGMIDKASGSLDINNNEEANIDDKNNITINYYIETEPIELEILDSDDIIIPKFSDFIATYSLLSVLSTNAESSTIKENTYKKVNISSLNTNSRSYNPDDHIPGVMPQSKLRSNSREEAANSNSTTTTSTTTSNSNSNASIIFQSKASSDVVGNEIAGKTATVATPAVAIPGSSNAFIQVKQQQLQQQTAIVSESTPSTPLVSPAPTTTQVQGSVLALPPAAFPVPASMKGFVNKQFRSKHQNNVFKNLYCALEVQSGMSILSYYKSSTDYKNNKSVDVDYLRQCTMQMESENVISLSILRVNDEEDEDDEEKVEEEEDGGKDDGENRDVNANQCDSGQAKEKVALSDTYTIWLELTDVPTIPDYKRKWIEALRQHVAYSNRKSQQLRSL